MTTKPHRRLIGPICRRCWRPHLPNTWAAHADEDLYQGRLPYRGEAMATVATPGLAEALIRDAR